MSSLIGSTLHFDVRIPHNFGLKVLPLLDSLKVIKTKCRVEGESERIKALDNCMILWLRSRRANRAGTWYMFGKVSYFSYMACRSADYCCTSPSFSRGCLLLCKVALGKTHDCFVGSTSRCLRQIGGGKVKSVPY
ncbi:Poly [ADP-ribose] polymerase [Echinococcus granulosus]|uniref:NAD(+) ADP-ribosyltransferase n=1 Tax=Echinococcus granulosus TaxID=6210 RepID=W6UZ52_ECHGR|nr:Poly [ADP-ribose] polymerase [Echinococcus granulosus]EUB58884.1 Poly [ADP-ribose] polymerase [Echinococcus granulosus]